MSSMPVVPEASSRLGIGFDFRPSLVQEEQDKSIELVEFNSFGAPFYRLGDIAVPAFVKPAAVLKLRSDWAARSNDVFSVFCHGSFRNDAFIAYTVALIEQKPVEKVDTEFPRWVDSAVARRGWGYVEALDKVTNRRCFTTHNPPELFPCSNSGACRSDSSSAAASPSLDMPRICVFVTDPRVMFMKACCIEHHMVKSATGDDTIEFKSAMQCLLDPQSHGLPRYGMFGGPVYHTAAWAEAEARCPDRIRLFFLEDFYMEPVTAMKGLSRFLGVSEISDATEAAIRESVRLSNLSHFAQVGPLQYDEILTGTFEDLTKTFEEFFADMTADLQSLWESQIQRLLQVPNPRLVAWASAAMKHEAWNPANWWAAHTARVCRPCLFFPRGTCSNDTCGYCHGPGHPKPKRPNHNKRKRRAIGNMRERTPSPDRSVYSGGMATQQTPENFQSSDTSQVPLGTVWVPVAIYQVPMMPVPFPQEVQW